MSLKSLRKESSPSVCWMEAMRQSQRGLKLWFRTRIARTCIQLEDNVSDSQKKHQQSAVGDFWSWMNFLMCSVGGKPTSETGSPRLLRGLGGQPSCANLSAVHTRPWYSRRGASGVGRGAAKTAYAPCSELWWVLDPGCVPYKWHDLCVLGVGALIAKACPEVRGVSVGVARRGPESRQLSHSRYQRGWGKTRNLFGEVCY